MHCTPSRRTFVKGLAAGGLLGGLGLWRSPVWALTSPGQPTVLAGSEFELFIDQTPVNLTGRHRTALTINGSLPGPLLRWREGDTVTLRVSSYPQRCELKPHQRPGRIARITCTA